MNTPETRDSAAPRPATDTGDDYVDPFDADWRERLLVLGSVFAVVVVAYILGMRYATAETVELTVAVPTSFFGAGKFLPLWAITGKSNFGPYELGLVIWAMDTVSVLLVVYALEGVYWIKPIKRGLDKVHANANLVLTAYPRMRRAATIGVVLFVLFPIAGTGAVGGAFIGVLLGMHRARLIAAVSFGGLLGGMLMAFLASNFSGALKNFKALQDDPTIKYAVIAAIAVVAIVIVYLLAKVYKRAIAAAEAELSKSHNLPAVDSDGRAASPATSS